MVLFKLQLKMKKALVLLVILNFTLVGLFAGDSVELVDKNISITRLSDKTWLLKSSYACNGQLDCNHLLIVDRNDLVLINTPAKDSLTAIMLDCIEQKFKRKVTKVIVSHFHDDSAGGLHETGKLGIVSYGSEKTRDLLKPENKIINIAFSDSLKISLQTIQFLLFYPGAGHTMDNIVIWVPGEKILFGGCLLKSLETNNKGNLKDADLKAWPATVQKVKNKFNEARIVIPGHGAIGDSTIFDQTLRIVTMK